MSAPGGGLWDPDHSLPSSGREKDITSNCPLGWWHPEVPSSWPWPWMTKWSQLWGITEEAKEAWQGQLPHSPPHLWGYRSIAKPVKSPYMAHKFKQSDTRECIRMLLFSCVSLPPHGLQHARLPCPSPPPRACSNSCPLSQWCHPTISSSVVPFSSCPQSFPASGSFPMNQLFASDG